MTGVEQKEARAGRGRHDNSQDVEDDEAARAAMLDKQYPTAARSGDGSGGSRRAPHDTARTDVASPAREAVEPALAHSRPLPPAFQPQGINSNAAAL